jgi:hypothetical protein
MNVIYHRNFPNNFGLFPKNAVLSNLKGLAVKITMNKMMPKAAVGWSMDVNFFSG